MQDRSTQRILTTHVGSLPRPKDVLDLMKAKVAGAPLDAKVYEAQIRCAVAECVRKQAETGIDILSDGEQSKPGFFTYVRERLEGFEPRPQQRMQGWPLEVSAFISRKQWAEALLHQSFRWSVLDRYDIAAAKRLSVTSKISKLLYPQSKRTPCSCRQ
jgi:methionine synthase II (cobalamin-independent)